MKKAIPFIGLLAILASSSGLLAHLTGYSQTNLVSDTAGVGKSCLRYQGTRSLHTALVGLG